MYELIIWSRDKTCKQSDEYLLHTVLQVGTPRVSATRH